MASRWRSCALFLMLAVCETKQAAMRLDSGEMEGWLWTPDSAIPVHWGQITVTGVPTPHIYNLTSRESLNIYIKVAVVAIYVGCTIGGLEPPSRERDFVWLKPVAQSSSTISLHLPVPHWQRCRLNLPASVKHLTSSHSNCPWSRLPTRLDMVCVFEAFRLWQCPEFLGGCGTHIPIWREGNLNLKV